MGYVILSVLLVLAVAFVGGAIGARVVRGRAASASEEALARLEAKADWLYAEQTRLIERVAALERERAVGARAAPGEVEPVQAPESAEPEERLSAVTDEAVRIPVEAAAAEEPAAGGESSAEAPMVSPPLPAAPQPRAPGAIQRWLFGGNTVVRVGVVILFFGVAFLLRYAYERVHVPVEWRLTGVAAGAIALLALGWRLRERRAGYALTLQGGAVGVLYLTVFAALRLYALLPPAAALALLTLLAVFSAVLALTQNSMPMAMLGAAGGFLAPVLASTGAGSHVQLFAYYALLNAGILFIAWHRSWRPLNLLGFAFTFVISGLWGWQYYRPALFATTEPFLALFFLMYVAIPVLHARRAAVSLRAPVDGTLVFGTPIVAFGLQLALVRDAEFGAAWSALALGAFYLVVARALLRRGSDALRLLFEAFLALGIVFLTLAVPLGFEGRWTAAAWALEGAAIVWISVRQDRLLGRVFGTLLQLGAGIAFLIDLPGGAGATPVLNSACLGGTLIALGALFSAWYLDRHADRLRGWESAMATLLFAWGGVWWFGTGLMQIDRHVPPAKGFGAALIFVSVSWVAMSAVAARADWLRGRTAAAGFAPVMGVAAAAAILGAAGHPGEGLGALAWPVALAAHLVLLRRHEDEVLALAPWLHAIGLWCAALLGAQELAWWIGRAVEGASAWPLVAWTVVPGGALAALAGADERARWPVGRQVRGYLVLGCGPLAVFLMGWALYATATDPGDAAPLPYVALLNPLDLAILGAALVVIRWHRDVRSRGLLTDRAASPAVRMSVLGAIAFVLANGILLRALHHWAGVPFDLERMLDSVVVQTAFSVFWTVLAMALMFVATRRGVRALWLAGAGLMGVVVVKLFLVDLSNAGGIERIVSFLAVGVLMLLIGYLSPVPPREDS